MKYELGSEDDASWGWWWWDDSTGQGTWKAWEDGSGNPYAVKTGDYSGNSAEFLYDGRWRPLAGGHGEDYVFFDETAGVGEGGLYYFWLDHGMDFTLDYRSGAGSSGVWSYLGSTGFSGMTEDWAYIGDGVFTFQSAGSGSVDQQWVVYDGSHGADDAWFTYECYSWNPGTALGAWDFDGSLDLAFLSGVASGDGGAYAENQQYLKENVISVTGSAYDGASVDDVVAMMGAISQSQGCEFFSTVMFHGQQADPYNHGFILGNSTINSDTVSGHQSAFGDMAGLLLGDGGGGQVHIMHSDTASTDTLRGILGTIQGYFDGHGPWGTMNSPTLWASYDATGDWSGVAESQPNWDMEWSHAGFDAGNPYANALGLSSLLYVNSFTGAGNTELNGDPYPHAELVADINGNSGGSALKDLTEFDGYLYFRADDGETGRELWRIPTDFDPATDSAELVADIGPGTIGTHEFWPTEFDGYLYFQANDDVHGHELWRIPTGFDPTTDSPERLTDIWVGSESGGTSRFMAFDGYLYFAADHPTYGVELWRIPTGFDPATDSPERVTDLDPGISDSGPISLTVFDGHLYFRADDGGVNHLWRIPTGFNPSTDTPELVSDIESTSTHARSQFPIVFGGHLYFTAEDASTGVELWRIPTGFDPGTDSPERVADLNSGSGSSTPDFLTELDGYLYFQADDGINGVEIWRIPLGFDPATDSPELVADINQGSGDGNPLYLTALNGYLYFAADDGVHGSELWRYDPLVDTAVLVADIDPGSVGSQPLYLTAFNGQIYFAADNGDGVNGRELWRF